MRDARYPYDYCPQLAALHRPVPSRVESHGAPYVDKDLHNFALLHQSRPLMIDGRERRVLIDPNVCRTLPLPERPVMRVALGFAAAEGSAGASAAAAETPAVVEASIHLVARGTTADGTTVAAESSSRKSPQSRVLFTRQVRFDPRPDGQPPPLLEERINLRAHGLETIELCFAAKAPDGAPPDPRFVWVNPVIRTARAKIDGNQKAEETETTEEAPEAVDPEEQAVREKLLRAHGYVD
jgi:hypothetical protein